MTLIDFQTSREVIKELKADQVHIDYLIRLGHTEKCAYRIVWYDGICVCEMSNIKEDFERVLNKHSNNYFNWLFEVRDDGVYCCKGNHDINEKCLFERLTFEEIFQIINKREEIANNLLKKKIH